MVLDTSTEGYYTTSRDNLFQRYVACIVKTFSPVFNWILLCIISRARLCSVVPSNRTTGNGEKLMLRKFRLYEVPQHQRVPTRFYQGPAHPLCSVFYVLCSSGTCKSRCRAKADSAGGNEGRVRLKQPFLLPARRLQPGPHRLLLPPRAHGRHCAAAAPPPPLGARHFPAGPAERGPVPPRSIPAPSAALPWEGRHGEAAAGAGRAGRWGAGTDGAGTARRESALPSPALPGGGAAPGRALPCSPLSPACTHAPPLPGACPSGAERGWHRQAKDRPKFAACAERRAVWAAGSAQRMSFGQLLMCEAFGCVGGGLGSFGFYKFFLCLSREQITYYAHFQPDWVCCSV